MIVYVDEYAVPDTYRRFHSDLHVTLGACRSRTPHSEATQNRFIKQLCPASLGGELVANVHPLRCVFKAVVTAVIDSERTNRCMTEPKISDCDLEGRKKSS